MSKKTHRIGMGIRGSSGRGGLPTRKAGFTLIELLVVIAIISLLVSILLPSLGKAKDLAKAAMCSSQTRNMALAFLVYREDWDFLPWGAYNKQYMPADAEYIGLGVYGLRMSVAIELEEKHGLDTINAYTCPAGPIPPRRWWPITHAGPPEPWDDHVYQSEGFTVDDYAIYTYLDGKDLTLPSKAYYPNNVADDAPVATHNNLTSEHAMVGDVAYSQRNATWVWNWHLTETSYDGFNTAYGDAHVEWTDADYDFFDDKYSAQYYNPWIPLCFWWK